MKIERFNELVKGGLRIIAASGLYLSTVSGVYAQEDFVLDNVTGTFHEESGAGVDDFISRMEAQGRINVLASRLVQALHARESLPRSYSISLDDGRKRQMRVLDVLRKRGKNATFFVMGRWNGDGVNNYMNEEDKILIVKSGNEIGAHTDNHPTNLPEMFFNNFGGFLQEVVGTKIYLENLTGKPIYVMAYPYGRVPHSGLDVISNHYLGAFTTAPGNLHYLSQANRLPRNSIN